MPRMRRPPPPPPGGPPGGHAFDQRALARLVRKAAGALGLEIYGGDCIATAAGKLVLIDLNAWPGFALSRERAAPPVAPYLSGRFPGGARGAGCASPDRGSPGRDPRRSWSA